MKNILNTTFKTFPFVTFQPLSFFLNVKETGTECNEDIRIKNRNTSHIWNATVQNGYLEWHGTAHMSKLICSCHGKPRPTETMVTESAGANEVSSSKPRAWFAFSVSVLGLASTSFRCHQPSRMAGWLWFRCLFGPNLNRTHRSPDPPRPDGRVARRVWLSVVPLCEWQNPSGMTTGMHAAECCAKHVSLHLTLAVLAIRAEVFLKGKAFANALWHREMHR